MQDINKVFISGNLTREPFVGTVPNSNLSVMSLNVAANKSYKSGNEWKNKANYIFCQIFGKQVEWLKDKIETGTLVFIEGELSVNSWKDQGSGEWKTITKVVVNNIRFNNKNTGREENAQIENDYQYYEDSMPPFNPEELDLPE